MSAMEKNTKKHIMKRNIILILTGNLFLAIAGGIFILPNEIVSGGVNGISLVLQPIIHVPVQVLIYVIIGIAFIGGLICMGKEFAGKTIASSILYPVFLRIVTDLIPPFTYNILIATVISAILVGFGIGLVLRAGASTGGMDIPPIFINKYFHIKIATTLLIMDSTTVLLGFVFYGPVKVVLGLISVFICTRVLHYTLIAK